MLADPRADSLTTNFAAQWLLLRNLATVRPGEPYLLAFDETLRRAFQTETAADDATAAATAHARSAPRRVMRASPTSSSSASSGRVYSVHDRGARYAPAYSSCRFSQLIGCDSCRPSGVRST